MPRRTLSVGLAMGIVGFFAGIAATGVRSAAALAVNFGLFVVFGFALGAVRVALVAGAARALDLRVHAL